jgi:Cd2+/Zn2+-exporting ATPase
VKDNKGKHEEHHHDDHDHAHKHEEHESKSSGLSETKKELIWIGAGLLVYVIALVFEHLLHFHKEAYVQDYLIAYLILGGGVLYAAIKNIGKGQLFDENFLMSIATVGAFVIGEYPEAVGVMLFYRIGEFFEELAVTRSRKQIMEAADLRPEVVNLLKGDEIVEIDAEDAEVSDIIAIRPGDRVPLDGIVVKGESRLDTSAVTGEPVPISVKEGSEVLSGCVNEDGLIHLKVTKILDESMVTRILDSVENAAASKPEFERFITKFARVYTPIVVAVALLTAIVPSIITGDWGKWI